MSAQAEHSSSGWIRLHRSLLHHDLWTAEPFTRGQAWTDLLLLANHKPGVIFVRGIAITVVRGQVGWSQVSLSQRWKWSRGKIRRFLEMLEKLEMIVQQNNNVSGLITITNYDAYQASEIASRIADGPQTDTNKNEKKKKKISPSKTPADSRYFSDWWSFSFYTLSGRSYIFEGGKDGGHISFLLRNMPLEESILRACDFLTSQDGFLIGKRTLSMFRSWINKTKPDGDRDEYRLAGIFPPEGIRLKEWLPWIQKKEAVNG